MITYQRCLIILAVSLNKNRKSIKFDAYCNSKPAPTDTSHDRHFPKSDNSASRRARSFKQELRRAIFRHSSRKAKNRSSTIRIRNRSSSERATKVCVRSLEHDISPRPPAAQRPLFIPEIFRPLSGLSSRPISRPRREPFPRRVYTNAASCCVPIKARAIKDTFAPPARPHALFLVIPRLRALDFCARSITRDLSRGRGRLAARGRAY